MNIYFSGWIPRFRLSVENGVRGMRTHTVLKMTPATKIDLFSVLTNPCDLTRLTTLSLLLIALLANMAVSFIAFDNQENAYSSSHFKFSAGIDHLASISHDKPQHCAAVNVGMVMKARNSRISLHVLFTVRSSSSLFGLFLAVPLVNTKPSTKKQKQNNRTHPPNL